MQVCLCPMHTFLLEFLYFSVLIGKSSFLINHTNNPLPSFQMSSFSFNTLFSSLQVVTWGRHKANRSSPQYKGSFIVAQVLWFIKTLKKDKNINFRPEFPI